MQSLCFPGAKPASGGRRWACCQPEAVRLLLERGARTDLKSSDIAGVMTPLELEMRHNRTEIAEILKQAREK